MKTLAGSHGENNNNNIMHFFLPSLKDGIYYFHNGHSTRATKATSSKNILKKLIHTRAFLLPTVSVEKTPTQATWIFFLRASQMINAHVDSTLSDGFSSRQLNVHLQNYGHTVIIISYILNITPSCLNT